MNNKKPLPFSFSWMGLTLTVAFAASGWLQHSSKLFVIGAATMIATAAYTALAYSRTENTAK